MNLKTIVSLSLILCDTVAGWQVNLPIQVRGLQFKRIKNSSKTILGRKKGKERQLDKKTCSPPLRLNPCNISDCGQSPQTNTSSTKNRTEKGLVCVGCKYQGTPSGARGKALTVEVKYLALLIQFYHPSFLEVEQIWLKRGRKGKSWMNQLRERVVKPHLFFSLTATA